MTGRELMHYIFDNDLLEAEVEGLEEISFTVPVKSVFVLQEKLESTLEYKPYSKSIWHVCAGDERTEQVSHKEAHMIRGEN